MEALTATDKCFSPARAMSPMPTMRPPASPDAASRYLEELLQEQQKLEPFVQVFPICGRLLNRRGVMGWQGAAQNQSSYIVKKIMRLEVPTDAYPNFNFICRLLGPRGHPRSSRQAPLEEREGSSV